MSFCFKRRAFGRGGFKFLGLVAAVAIIAFSLVVLVPLLQTARETAAFGDDATNLKLQERATTMSSTTVPTAGPLRIHPANPRYFADSAGNPVYMTGSHTWDNLVRVNGPSGESMDFDAYLDFMVSHGHNFMRGWSREGRGWIHEPIVHRFERTGPGTANDDKPKFDLTRLNPEYFDTIRSRVIAAGKRGIYVSVMLFDASGWNEQRVSTIHPFHRNNNINGIDADPTNEGKGRDIVTLADPRVVAIQESVARKIVDTVNDLDNVVYEIINEAPEYSTEFQYHMIRFIREYEKSKPKQHLIGMTSNGGAPPDDRARLFNSQADWISPGHDSSFPAYMDDPPATLGDKVIVLDTDHIWGVGGDRQWVWKSFLRGYNPIYMDPYKDKDRRATLSVAEDVFERARKAMGHTLMYARKMNLASMKPNNWLSSTGYCLADPGKEYLVYQPKSGAFKLMFGPGTFQCEWFNPETGTAVPGEVVSTKGEEKSFSPPFEGDAVLYLKAASGETPGR